MTLSSRALLELSGKDVRSFLQGLITQDICTVTPSHSAYSALLNAQGKYLFDFFLIDRTDSLWLECDKAYTPGLLRLLRMYKLRADVTLEDISDKFHIHAALGDVSQLALPPIEGRTEYFHDARIVAFTDPRYNLLGARIIAPAGEGETWLAQRGFSHALESDYEHRRIALGIPDSRIDNLPEKTLILENGFEELNGVSFTKGCYVGQEVTARTKHRANLHKLLFKVEGNAPLPEPGTSIKIGEREVGQMRSSIENQGLAILRLDSAHLHGLETDGVQLIAGNPPWRKAHTL